MMKIGVAAIGDVLDINCWSNTPYYFYTTGERLGLFNEPWSLQLNQFKRSRRLWNIGRLLSGKGFGGYQYSKSFLNKAEAQIPAPYFSSHVVSFNQVFPRASSIIKSGGKIYYYIDVTLMDLFNEPDYGIHIPLSMREEALAQEKENYAKAEAIITMGSWVHNSLLKFYDLPSNKIFHVLPGSNINVPESYSTNSFSEGAGVERDLVLGFIGKDWERKGLLFLLDVRDEIEKRGCRVIVKAIGNCPEELRARRGLEYTGFIDKQHDTEKFIKIISGCDIGCLFSASEALGISTLEFLRLGVPVAGFYHQGLIDTLLSGASLRFPLQSSIDSVADSFEEYVRNKRMQIDMKSKAMEYSGQVSWENSVQQLKKIIRG